MKQKERKDIAKESTWNLNPLYSSAKKWEEDFASLDKLLKTANRLKGKLTETPANLKKAFDKFDQLHRTLEKIYVFAHLKSDEDLSNSQNTGTLNRVTA